MIFNYNLETPAWLVGIGTPAFYLTVALLPIYIAWVVFSKQLSVREKLRWGFIVILANMIGMPWFYIFIVRRYLGLENKTNMRDEKTLETFLKKYEIKRESLSQNQQKILCTYCRKQRLQKLGTIFLFPLAALIFYLSIIYFPDEAIRLFSDFAPTKTIIINSVNNTTNELASSALLQKEYSNVTLLFGAMIGIFAAMSIVTLINCFRILFTNSQHKLLIDFIKAEEKL